VVNYTHISSGAQAKFIFFAKTAGKKNSANEAEL